VRGQGNDATPEAALSDFSAFPRWMWRNEVVRDLVAWLRKHNTALAANETRVGFYGMDVYSLPESINAVESGLQAVNAQAAQTARRSYECFDGHRKDPESYGLAALMRPAASCERAVAEQLTQTQKLYAAQRASNAQAPQTEALFSAWQNARVVRNAEEYYRVMYTGNVSSWNLRDKHMADTLDALRTHLGTKEQPAKIVVWAHNSHVGDARLTTWGNRANGRWGS
jgi:erythromycin esterase-like protein